MAAFIGLLRAVNLGSHNRVSMSALRDLLTDLGMRNVRTLVQSGNVVFETRARNASRLEQVLEEATAERLGVTTDYMVRTPDEWRDAMARNPFAEEAAARPNLGFLVALKSPPSAADAAAFEHSHTGPERVHIHHRHVYIVYPNGVGPSRLTGASIEKRLGTRGTARNWNTVRKLETMVGG